MEAKKETVPCQNEEFSENSSSSDFAEWTPLMYAARNGKADEVKQILADDSNPHYSNSHNVDAFQLAARSGNVETAKVLAKFANNENTRHALSIACLSGHPDIVTFIGEGECSSHLTESDWNFALEMAKIGKHDEIANFVAGKLFRYDRPKVDAFSTPKGRKRPVTQFHDSPLIGRKLARSNDFENIKIDSALYSFLTPPRPKTPTQRLKNMWRKVTKKSKKY